MKKYKKRFKPRATKRALGVRGGFAPSVPYTRPIGYTKVGKINRQDITDSWNTLLKQAQKVGVGKAKDFLLDVAKTRTIKIGKTEITLTKNPSADIAGPSKTKSPTESTYTRNTISGSNKLFTAHRHKWHVTTGKEPTGWIKRAMKDNGLSKHKFLDTVENFDLQSTSRSGLFSDFGFNQKYQQAIYNTLFGWRVNDLEDEFTFKSSGPYSTSPSKEQKAYLGIVKLSSRALITNMNRYVPAYVRLSLVNVDNDQSLSDLFSSSCNATLVTQEEGKMPLYNQISTAITTVAGPKLLVDPQSSGVKGSNIWKNSSSVIKSRTFKLAAGDHIEFTYDHLCGSGLRLDKLFGHLDSAGIGRYLPITHSLLIEAWGEQVECVNIQNPDRVMKGSCIGSLQFEFSKTIEGALSSENAYTAINSPAPSYGWRSHRFALRLFSEQVTASTGTPRFSLDHSDVDNVNYTIPVMSDSSPVSAGTNN